MTLASKLRRYKAYLESGDTARVEELAKHPAVKEALSNEVKPEVKETSKKSK